MAITGITVAHLDAWPEKTQTRNPKRSQFGANWFRTEKDLVKELNVVPTRNRKLFTFHSARDIRQDGWIRGDARRPKSPGVILEFERRIAGTANYEKLRFPCDTFDKWEDNVRAIALALEALRKVDRYGVTTGAQYAGYKALPPGPQAPPPAMTPEEAASFIIATVKSQVPVEILLSEPNLADWTYKNAAKLLHPDKEGGSQEEFAKLESAMSIVREYQKGL